MLWFEPRDPRDVRDKLRSQVTDLAMKHGPDAIRPSLLDEACEIAASHGMRAARHYIAKAAPLPS